MFTQSGEWAIISRHRVVITYLKSLKFRVFLVLLLAGWLPMLIVASGILDSYREKCPESMKSAYEMISADEAMNLKLTF